MLNGVFQVQKKLSCIDSILAIISITTKMVILKSFTLHFHTFFSVTLSKATCIGQSTKSLQTLQELCNTVTTITV